MGSKTHFEYQKSSFNPPWLICQLIQFCSVNPFSSTEHLILLMSPIHSHCGRWTFIKHYGCYMSLHEYRKRPELHKIVWAGYAWQFTGDRIGTMAEHNHIENGACFNTKMSFYQHRKSYHRYIWSYKCLTSTMRFYILTKWQISPRM